MSRYVGWKELYDNFDVNGAYPLTSLSSIISEIFKTRETVYFDFTGIDQLSDEVFHLLKECLHVWQKACVVGVKCAGCHRITDNGIELLAQSFFNIKQINLDGCNQLTERSLCYLNRYCSQLTGVSMIGTNVSTLPLNLDAELPVRLDGCPLFRPLAKAFSGKSPQVLTSSKAKALGGVIDNEIKVVILTTQAIRLNVTNYIRTGKLEKLETDRDVQITSYKEMNGDTEQTYNVFEVHSIEPAVYAPFVTDRAIYFIVIELENSEYPQNEVMNRIDFIRAIALQAPIIVLALYGTQRGKNDVKKVAEDLVTMFKEQEKNLDEHLEKENFQSDKVFEKDFPHQQRYVQSLRCKQKCNYSISYICVPTPFHERKTSTSGTVEHAKPMQLQQQQQVQQQSNRIVITKLAKNPRKAEAIQQDLEDPDLLSRMAQAKSVLEDHFSRQMTPTNLLTLPVNYFKILSVQQDSATALMEDYWELNEWKNAVDALDRTTQKDMTEVAQLNVVPLPDWPVIPEQETLSVNTIYQCVINSMLTLMRNEYKQHKRPSLNPTKAPMMKAAPMMMKSKKAIITKGDFLPEFDDGEEQEQLSQDTWWQHVTNVITDTGFIRALKKFRPQQTVGVSMMTIIDPWVAIVDQFLEENTIRQTGLAAIWLWVKAMHSYLAIMIRKESEEKTNYASLLNPTINESASPVEILRIKLTQAVAELKHVFYQWEHNLLPPEVEKFYQTVLDQSGPLSNMKILTADQLFSLTKNDISTTFSNDRRAAAHALNRLARSGRLIMFDGKENAAATSLADQSLLVIRDLETFVRLTEQMQHADQQQDSPNENRLLSIARSTPLLDEQQLAGLITSIGYSESESGVVKTFLQRAGWLITSDVFDEKRLFLAPHYFSALHLSAKPFLRKSATTTHSDAVFRKVLFPNYRSEDANPSDVDLIFSFKFRQGMSSNLFQLILAEAFNLPVWKPLLVWQSGALMQCSAAELLISYNMHGSMSSGAIELTARTSRFAFSYVPAIDYVIRDYLWSVMSVFVVLIEGIISKFPVMHHKLRYTCRGQCYDEGSGDTFSPVQIARTLHEVPLCTKCKSYQSDQCKWSFYHGRRFFLPQHDWTDEQPKRVAYSSVSELTEVSNVRCKHCGLSREFIWKLFSAQVSTYPPFASDCFELLEQESSPQVLLRGSVLLGVAAGETAVDPQSPVKSRPATASRSRPNTAAASSDSNTLNHVFVRCTRPLKYRLCERVRLTLLKATGELQCSLIQRLDFDLSFSSPAPANHWNMRRLLTLKLQNGKIVQADCYDWKTKEDAPLGLDATFGPGDTLEIIALDILRNESDNADSDSELLFNRFGILRNTELLCTFVLPENCHFILESTISKRDAVGPLCMLSAPDCPIVTADHFSPGMLLLFKTKVGNWWSPGIVKRVQNGKLHVSELSKAGDPKDNGVHAFAPTSRSICPIGLYPDEINVSGEITFDTWFNFLRDRRESIATPFGLFNTAFRESKMFRELPIRRFASRACSMLSNSEQALRMLQQSMEVHLAMSKSRHYFVLLPAADAMSYYLPTRQMAHKWTALSANYLCSGINFGKTPSTDAHFLNAAGAVPTSSAIDMRMLFMGSLVQIAECQTMMLRSPVVINKWNKLFPEMTDADAHEVLVGRLAWRYLNLYQATVGLFVACTSASLKEFTFATPALQQLQLVVKDLTDEDVLSKTLQANSAWLQENIPVECYATNQLEVDDDKQSAKRAVSVNSRCPLHHLLAQESCWPTLVTQPLDPMYEEAAPRVRTVNFSKLSSLQSMPILLMRSLRSLVAIDLVESAVESIDGVGSVCPKLKSLFLRGNRIKKLDGDFAQLASSLRNLQLSNNPLIELPAYLAEFRELNTLLLSDTQLTRLPEQLPPNLKILDISRTRISSVAALPKSLEQFTASGVAMPTPTSGNQPQYTWAAIEKWARETNCEQFDVKLSDIQDLFNKHCTESLQVVKDDSLKPFENDLFQMFPRFGLPITPENEQTDRFPASLFSCPNLKLIRLGYQAMREVPDRIQRLRRLEVLILTGCPYLETVSGEAGKAQISNLGLTGCPMLKTPPLEIVRQGMSSTLAYLKRLSSGSVECFRTKLMFVGLGGAGKTSLMRSLMSTNDKATNIENEGITDGIQISSWSVPLPNKKAMTFSVWDFAGQTLYYNTHQFFITNRAVYLLIWNIRLGYEHAGLEFWLSSVKCHAPDAPIFVIGTHCDQVAMTELNEQDIMAKFPQITGFFSVSSATGFGITELREALIQTTMKQPYVGERVPEAWLNFEMAVLQKRAEVSFLRWSQVTSLALASAIYDQEVQQAVGFLHQLGSVQHFDSDLLRDVVVINPQWIVDVMACLVSVHNGVIIDGRMDHKDVATIWKAYPKSLHPWLLSLTEAFDLTFPLADENVSIVPCLLPVDEPENLEWLDYEQTELKNRGLRETKILYKFDYLPPGLFNRVQVRLCQFSSKSAIWKRGSLMNKAGHDALMVMVGENDVSIRVQGPRPENFLLLVHEVFEGLISEAFSGVTYEYYIPCYDCLDSSVKEPAMFSGNVLRRAVERKALFLQCHVMFHTLGVADMQSLMPPETNTDFTLQLEATIKDLDRFRQGKAKLIDAFVLYNPEDMPESEDDGAVLHVQKLCVDLDKVGIKVLVLKDLLNVGVDEIVRTLQSCALIIVMMTKNFPHSEQCTRIFDYVLNSKKKIQLILADSSNDWRLSSIGPSLAGELYVDFTDRQMYTKKIDELKHALDGKLRVQKSAAEESYDVFISYCWSNSKEALVQTNMKEIPGAVGEMDPRNLKKLFAENGLACWIDIDKLGSSPLYQDIVNGLNKSKVMVVCISDQYAASMACQTEFRYGHLILRIPMIIVSVASNINWQNTEIGMLSLNHPRVNLQVANDENKQNLLQLVKEKVEQQIEKAKSQPATQTTPEQLDQNPAYVELYEVAQRKLFRLIGTFITQSLDAEPFPYVFTIDVPSEAELTAAGLPNRLMASLLCEYEGGWHVPTEQVPYRLRLAKGRFLKMQRTRQGFGMMKQDEVDVQKFVKLTAPYFALTTLILRNSDKTNLNLFKLYEAGNASAINLINFYEDTLVKLQKGEIKVVIKLLYLVVRHLLQKIEATRQEEGAPAAIRLGGLRRCRMTNGKISWLCKEHRQMKELRVSVLGDMHDDENTNAAKFEQNEQLRNQNSATAHEENNCLMNLSNAWQGEMVNLPTVAMNTAPAPAAAASTASRETEGGSSPKPERIKSAKQSPAGEKKVKAVVSTLIEAKPTDAKPPVPSTSNGSVKSPMKSAEQPANKNVEKLAKPQPLQSLPISPRQIEIKPPVKGAEVCTVS